MQRLADCPPYKRYDRVARDLMKRSNLVAEDLQRILSCLSKLASKKKRTSIEDVVKALGHRSYGPFLLIPALMVISPLGALPAFSTIMSVIVIFFSCQIIVGRDHFWLPRVLSKRSVQSRYIQNAVTRLKPVAIKLDCWSHKRWPFLAKGVFIRMAAVCCIFLAAAVPPLEIFPFASALPMVIVSIFGLAILVQDGSLMLLGYGLIVTAIGILIKEW